MPSADIRGRAAVQPNTSTDGCRMIRVPANPTRIALIRRMRRRSPSRTADSTVRISGWAKKIAMASAMGRCFRAAKKKTVAAASSNPRTICRTSVPFGTDQAPAMITKGSIRTDCIKKRQKAISSGPDVWPRSLANTSRPGMTSIPKLSNAIPRPGCCILCAITFIRASCALLAEPVNQCVFNSSRTASLKFACGRCRL